MATAGHVGGGQGVRRFSLEGEVVQPRVYIWREFAPAYRSGLAFAIARTEHEARGLVIDLLGYEPMEWGPVEIVEMCNSCGTAGAVFGGD